MQQASLEHEEIQSLKQQLQKMKELLRASQPTHIPSRPHESVETERYKIHIEKLISLVIDREKKIESLQQEKNVLDVANERIKDALNKEIESKKAAIEEVKALHAQFGLLKKIAAEAKGQIKEHENEKAKWQGERETLVQQLDAATQGFHEKANLQQDYELLKEKNQELASQIERAVSSIKESDRLLQAKEERLISMQEALMHAEKRLQEVVDEKYQLQDRLLRVQNSQEDAEARLKAAQYHLAKKVKETTELNDKLQSQEIYLREAYADLTAFQSKAQDLQVILDEKEKEKLRLEKQLQEAALSSQNSFVQLEEKCQKLKHKS
jgi:chromosome segregation ATPase